LFPYAIVFQWDLFNLFLNPFINSSRLAFIFLLNVISLFIHLSILQHHFVTAHHNSRQTYNLEHTLFYQYFNLWLSLRWKHQKWLFTEENLYIAQPFFSVCDHRLQEKGFWTQDCLHSLFPSLSISLFHFHHIISIYFSYMSIFL